jgi:alpha-amylase
MKKLFTLFMLLMASVAVSLAQDTWTVAGTAAALNGTTDWAPTNAENDMTSDDGTNYTLTVTNCTLEAAVDYQYKVVKNHAWTEAYPVQNKVFRVSETAIYTVVYHFNAQTHDVSEDVTKTGNAGEVTHVYSVAGSPATVFGAAWSETSETTEMQLGTDGLYWWKANGVTLAAQTKVEFKVVQDHSWGIAYPGSNYTVTIEEDGIYDLTFTFDPDTKGVNCIVEKKGNADVEAIFIVAGSLESLFGATWDGTNEANKLEKGDDGVYSKTYKDVTLPAGNIEWKVVQNGTTWIPEGENNNLIVTVGEEGVYDLTFSYNPANNTLSSKLMKDGQEIIIVPKGEGWPANYAGVMLQGFYWNSFEDTKLTELQKQVDDLSTYFDLVWLPNTGATGGTGMGYLPVYWLNHNSNFGRQNTLKKLIASLNAKGTKVIEDVVLNHKAPKGVNGSWVDFVDEKWTHDGITEEITWTPADICRNDDGGYTNTVGASEEMVEMNGGWECTGANDEGDDFSGGRDLDHTSANVQKNCITYLNFLQKELGYSGYRLDMVKGYSAYYTRMYNEATLPEFCVGEYWDGQDAITNWIAGTGLTSAAFDFPFKYQMKEAFNNGNWSALDYKGMAGDTYENESKHVYNVLAANAFMLAMPGTPCVFLKHWQRYPIAIGNMILARKAAGITNQSPIVEAHTADGGYVLKVQGTNGTVLCIAGFVQMDTTGFTLIASGDNFAYFVSNNITVEGLREGSDDEEAKELTIYVEAAEAPYLYTWNGAGQPTNGAWPGTQLTTTVTKEDNKVFWTRTFSTAPVNMIINDGGEKQTNDDDEVIATGNNAVQTADIKGLTHDSYFTFDPTNTDMETNWTDVTSNYYTPEPVNLPACAKPIDSHIYCYFQGNKDYDSPRAWAWLGDKNFCGEWPGTRMTRVGDDGNGHLVWCWDGGDFMDLFDTYTPDEALFPSNILFNNGGTDPKTADFKFENGGYYDATGLLGNVITGTQGITAPAVQYVAIPSQPTYNLQGQRVSNNYRGIVITQGRKVMVK